MISGALIVIEPWVPADQIIQREFVVVGRSLPGDGLILVADEPLGWNGWGQGSVLIVRPRLAGASIFGVTTAVVSGSIWGGRWKDPLRFIADLTLEEPIAPEPT